MESVPLDIELLLGAYRSGKTRTLVAELLAFKKNNPLKSALVLVPSARYGRLFREILHTEMASQNIVGLWGVEILPFYHACLEELRKRRGEPNILPEEIRPALMANVLSQMNSQGEIKSLSAISEFHGTASAELELIDEFQRAGLSADDLSARLEESCCQESRFLELAHIYQRYCQRLQQLELHDQKSMAMSCREALFAEARPDFGILLIDGFDRVSHLQAQIFAGFSRCAERTLIAFDYVRESAEEIASGSVISLSQSPEDYRWKEASLNELVLNLQPAIKVMKPASDQSLVQKLVVESSTSLDRFVEMQELVRNIKTAIVERKRKPSEILVVIRSYDSYAGAIETAFQDAGISYFIDGSAALAELAPWQFIKRMFLLSQNEFRRKEVIDLLRSPYLNLEAVGLSARAVSQVDRISYQMRLVGGFDGWQKLFLSEKLSELSSSFGSFLEQLNFDDSSLDLQLHCQRLETVLEKLMRFPASEHDLRSARANHERETIKAVRRCLKLMLTQKEILGQESETFAEFFQRFQSLIERANFPRPRPDVDVVTVSSAELAANRPFAEIFICGMVEGDFPKHVSAKGFLSPEESKRWLSFGIDIRNPRHEPGFERALFYSVLERAKERLILSSPQFELSSEELLPSFYLSELQERIAVQKSGSGPYVNGLCKPFSSRDAIASILWHSDSLEHKQFQLLDRLSDSHAAISVQWIPIQNALQAVIGRMNLQTANPYNGYLEEFFNCQALSIDLPETWSASKLNDYGKCPFKFWASHVLDLEAREEPELGLTPALIGLTYHKILELFFQSFSKTDPKDRQTLSAGLLDIAFEGGLEWLEKRPDFTAGPYFEHEKKELRFRVGRFVRNELQRIADDEDSFFPQMFEVGFGRRDSLFPPLHLEDEFGKKILISGSIDRVDLRRVQTDSSEDEPKEREFARLIDYKTSSRVISIKEAEQGRNLQLPIYAMALSKSILPKTNVCGGQYLSISSARGVGRIDFDSPEHGHILDRSEFLIKSYVAEIQRGVFSVKPNGKEVCKTCEHKSVCRIAELKAVMEESNDAEAY